jgi:hypothetical protein
MGKIIFCLSFFVIVCGLKAQDNSYIKIHFKYGSKPGKEYKKTESKYFGGIHGGHVTVEIGDSIYGFSPAQGGARILARKSHSNGNFHLEDSLEYRFDENSNKQTTIKIPVTKEEIICLKKYVKNYLNKAPYDYALFGMRCAASAHEMLSIAGIFKKRTKLFSIFYNFYPKKLRKRILDKAFEENYDIIHQEGRKERKWENDKRRHREKLKLQIRK